MISLNFGGGDLPPKDDENMDDDNLIIDEGIEDEQ